MGTMTETAASKKNDSLLEINGSSGRLRDNGTDKDNEPLGYYESGYFDPKADVLPLVLAVLIIFVNTLVLILILRKKHLRSSTNLLLCSLALSDLLTGLVSVPLFITCSILRQSAVCIMEEQMSRFISSSIVCHLMSVTLDRYLAIIHPLRYASIVTRFKCIMVILFIWLLSAVTALVQFSWLDPFHHDPNEKPSDEFYKKEFIYDVIFLAVYFVLPIGIMFFTYAKITLEIARQSRNIHQTYRPAFPHTRSRSRHERKAIAIFAAMLLLYVICWLPYFGIRRFDDVNIPIPLIYVIFWMRFLASLLNPCIYILGKQDFRKAIFDQRLRLDLNLTSTSKSIVLKNTLAISGGKNEKIYMKSFSRIGSRKT